MDGARISQLCTYLEKIHQKNMALEPHTTLLLSAYIKLNAAEKISEFVNQSKQFKNMDVEGTVKVLII